MHSFMYKCNSSLYICMYCNVLYACSAISSYNFLNSPSIP